jgi:hypothetical protein
MAGVLMVFRGKCCYDFASWQIARARPSRTNCTMEWRNGWQSVKPKANCRRKLFSFHGSYDEQQNRARYEVRPRKDKRGVDLISEALPFGRLWYGEPNAISNAIGYAIHSSRSHDAAIRVYDAAGNVIETHEHAGDFKEW